MHNSSKKLVLSWPRFALVFSAIGIVFSLFVLPDLSKGWNYQSLAFMVFFASMLFFFAYRYGKLRASLGIVSTIPNDPGDLVRKLIGPIFPATFWLLGTVVAFIGISLFGSN